MPRHYSSQGFSGSAKTLQTQLPFSHGRFKSSPFSFSLLILLTYFLSLPLLSLVSTKVDTHKLPSLWTKLSPTNHRRLCHVKKKPQSSCKTSSIAWNSDAHLVLLLFLWEKLVKTVSLWLFGQSDSDSVIFLWWVSDLPLRPLKNRFLFCFVFLASD